MIDHSLPYLVNCSLLFTEEPLLGRPAAARAAGFEAVEFWWPWRRRCRPTARSTRSSRRSSDAGVALVGLNFFAGDLAGPDCGVLSIPAAAASSATTSTWRRDRRAARRARVQRAVREPGRRGGPGRPRTSWPSRTSRSRPRPRPGSAPPCSSSRSAGPSPTRCARPTTRWPWSGGPGRRAPPTWASSATCTTWPATATTSTRRSRPRRRHRARADRRRARPGRAGQRRAGSGPLPAALEDHGYRGWVSLEYKPTTTTEASLAWLPARAPALDLPGRGSS